MEMIVKTVLAILVAHLVLGVILWLRVRKLYVYPGLLGYPVFGNIFYFYKTLFLGSMESLEKHMVRITEKNGKNGLCFHWVYGFRTSVIVSSPQAVKETAFHPYLSDKPHFMYGGFATYLDGPFASSRLDGLLKMKKKEYNTCLKRSHVNSDYYNKFLKCADKLVGLIMASSSAVNPQDVTTGVILNATVETLFETETTFVYHPEIIYTMEKMVELGSFIWANPKLAEIILTLMRPIDRVIFPKLTDLRKLLLKEKDKMLVSNQCSYTEQALSIQIAKRYLKYKGSEKTLINELQEIFFTSSHTVTSALSNSIIFLAALPDFQEIAWQEQFEIFGTDSRDPTIDDIDQMHFLDRFIKESLRFLSPPFIGKLATGDININGITIPKGTILIYLLRYMRMNPKHWKNPKVFDPDRFLEESDTLKHSYSPFGLGFRTCPGMYYATLLMKVTLSKILRRIKLEPVQKDFRFEDIQYKCSIMMEVANPPLLQVEERKS